MLVHKRRCCKQLSFWLFGLMLGFCSLWQVWDQCTKFMEGSTTISLERRNRGNIPLPIIALCMKQRFKDGVLASFGLPDDFFDNRKRTSLHLQAMPNLAEVWNNATWSLDDLQIDWTQYRYSSTKAGRVYSVNTVYVGKCFLISPGISEYQQQEKMLKPPNIAISSPTDDSRVQVYIIRDDSENALILDYWHYPIKPLELKNNMFMGLSLTKEYHIRIPREDSPCNKIPEKSYYKCLGKVMTNGYMKYPNTSCPGVIGACWIPQADSIIHKIRALPQCDSFEKYICMLNGYRNTRYEAKRQCLKSCKAENYKAVSRTNDIEPFPYNGKFWKTLVVLQYETNTIFNYRETELNDLNAIVASVGGSLGLFLGFSCYQMGKRFIERLPDSK